MPGTEVQALMLVASDVKAHQPFALFADETERCLSGLTAWTFTPIHQDDVFFVRADFVPQACGSTAVYVDAALHYAVKNGRIIRKKGEAEPE